MGRKLWLFTGGALALVLAIDVMGIFVPSFQLEIPLAFIIVAGIWAVLGLLVCSLKHGE